MAAMRRGSLKGCSISVILSRYSLKPGSILVPPHDTALFIPIAKYDARCRSIAQINLVNGGTVSMPVQHDVNTVFT